MIYADYNGSAPICDEVKKYLMERLENGPYANPNAIHRLGTKVLNGMGKSRKVCADVLGASPSQIVFNSGSSEGISQIFHSVLFPHIGGQKNKIVISGIEHSAIYSAADHYKELGFEVLTIQTQADGIIDLNNLSSIVEKNHNEIAMVTAMAANNETGVIQPYKEIGAICQQYKIPYFSDTTQYIGKTDFNFADSGMDYAVLSGHKIGALTGSGLIIAKDPTTLLPIVFGGGQERGFRGGTQNYLGIETMAVALKDFHDKKEKLGNLRHWREQFEKNIKSRYPQVVVVGDDAPRLAGSSLIAYKGIHGQGVQIELESQNIFVTTSSACSDNEPATSKVLKAMGIGDDIGRGVVRISLGTCSTEEHFKTIERELCKAYDKLSKIKSY